MSIVTFTICAPESKDDPHTNATGIPNSDGSNALSRVIEMHRRGTAACPRADPRATELGSCQWDTDRRAVASAGRHRR